MDFVQKSNLFLLLFLQKLCQKRSFFVILNKKYHFKTKKLKLKAGPKHGLFLKGLVHGFCRKI